MLKADILRSAVLLLHATFEDLLRSGEELRFLEAPARAFKTIRWVPTPPLDGKKLKDTLTLDELAEFRGQSINDVLFRALQLHLERSNYNNEHDVVGALDRMGLDKRPFVQLFPRLATMMARRHLIAHRADANGKFPHLTNPISKKSVEQWLGAVESFGDVLLAGL